MNPFAQKTNGAYLQAWWQHLPAGRRRRWRIFAGLLGSIWLAGALHGPAAVAGLARVEGPVRLLMALGLGAFSFLWRLLKVTGVVEETAQRPNALWVPLALVVPATAGAIAYLLSREAHPLVSLNRMLAGMARAQGRVEPTEAVRALSIRQGVPLAQVSDGKEQCVVGLDYDSTEGHVLVVAPTHAGKGLHLTETLRHYPGPALVIDPKGEQFTRTAALRSRLGPIYRIPGHQVHLSAYYQHLRDRDEIGELHYHLLRPWASREPIFLEKSLSLFTAVGLYAQATGRNPLRLLLDLAESNPEEALAALRALPAARRHVDIFTNGAVPTAYHEDRFVTSALGNFTTRLAPYQKHIDTITPPDVGRREQILDPDWVARNATIYVTYGLNDLRAAGGVVAALIAALLRYHLRQGKKQRALVAIDELPAVGLRNVADYLSTCGGFGITCLLYVQSIAQLQEIYGRDGTRAILSNCAHQIWYPAAELETARFMSELYGTTLRAMPAQSAAQGARELRSHAGAATRQTNRQQSTSWAWREEAVLNANEMVALPGEQVLVTTQTTGAGPGQRYTFLGGRLNGIQLFDRLPAPDGLRLPEPIRRPRAYTDWSQLAAAGQAAATHAGNSTASRATPACKVGGESPANGEDAVPADGGDELLPPEATRLMR